MPTDAFFKPARIFDELDLFQRDPAWLALFPDRSDETILPRGEIYISIVRDRRGGAAARGGESDRGVSASRGGSPSRAGNGGSERVLWSLHADQWVYEDEHNPATPVIAPAELLGLSVTADPGAVMMGTETEPGIDEGTVAFYTWAELWLTPTEAKELLRKLCDRFQKSFPDRDEN